VPTRTYALRAGMRHHVAF